MDIDRETARNGLAIVLDVVNTVEADEMRSCQDITISALISPRQCQELFKRQNLPSQCL
jgi:hypothetical protein